MLKVGRFSYSTGTSNIQHRTFNIQQLLGKGGLKAPPINSEAADVAEERLGTEEDEGDDDNNYDFAETDIEGHGRNFCKQ